MNTYILLHGLSYHSKHSIFGGIILDTTDSGFLSEMLRTTPTDAINGLLFGIRTGKTKGKSESWNRVGFFSLSFASDMLEPFARVYFCRFSHCYIDYDHVNPQCSIFGAEELTANFSPRPLPRNSVWINRDRYLAFLNI